jgi:hypothetical protein
MIIGYMLTPITVQVSWNCEPAVTSPLDVMKKEMEVALKGILRVMVMLYWLVPS